MKKLLEETNNILVNHSSTLPLNFGEIQAKEHLKKFKVNLIREFNEPELNPEFIKEVQNTEKQESVLVENLDDLFD